MKESGFARFAHLMVVGFVAFAALAAPSQGLALVTAEPFRVNTTSFAGLFGGVSPSRVIQAAFNQWRAVAGANVHFPFEGTSTATDCTSQNVVFAVPGAYFWDNSIAAQFWHGCAGGKWKVTVYSAPIAGGTVFTWTLTTPTLTTQLDMHSVMLHEIGHRFHWGHPAASPEACVLDSPMPAGMLGRYFCNREIPIVLTQLLAGTGENTLQYLESSQAAFPSPTGWTSFPMFPGSATGGAAHVSAADGSIAPSSSTTRFLTFGDPISSVVTTSPYPTISTSTIAPTSLLNPTLLYDPVTKKWWAFGRTSIVGTADTSLWWSVTTDPSNPAAWSTATTATTSNGSAIISRLPPGAAVDPVRGRIVLAWAEFPTGILKVSTIDRNVAGGTPAAFEPVGSLVAVGASAPTIGCANDTPFRCEAIYMSGADTSRSIGFVRFSKEANSITSSSESLSGTSDFPPSMVSPLAPWSNLFVVTVRGTDAAGTFFVKTRAVGSSTWSAWTTIGFANSLGGGPRLTVGPDLRYRIVF